MTDYNNFLNRHLEGCHHKDDCDGLFEHKLIEDVPLVPPPHVNVPLKAKVGSFAVCEKCGAAYLTDGFEHWLETYRAYKLMDKEGPLTTEEKRYLRLHFQMVDQEYARS